MLILTAWDLPVWALAVSVRAAVDALSPAWCPRPILGQKALKCPAA